MRIFVSLNPSQDVKEKIHSIQWGLQMMMGTDITQYIKWEEKFKYHVTMMFIGNATPEKTRDVCQSLSLIKDFGPIDIEAQKINVFPFFYRPRVLLVDLLNPNGKLLELNEEIKKKMAAEGFTSTEEFSAHITLGRVKKQIKKIDMNVLKRVPCDFKFEANSFFLMESVLDQKGSTYKQIKEFPL